MEATSRRHLGGDGLNINAQALVTRWELTKQDTNHPAYLIAKAILDYDLDPQSVMSATRQWMRHPHRNYTGQWSWADVMQVLLMYKEVSE